MRVLFALVAKEVVERRLLFLAGGVLGVLAVTLPLLLAMETRASRELTTMVAVAIGAAFSVSVSIVIGSTLLNSDLFDRRTSFYFSRPVSGSAFWTGRVIAGFGITLGATLLTLLPALLLGGDLRYLALPDDPAGALVVLVASIAVLLIASHVATALFRDRSLWLLFDLVAVAIAGFTSWLGYDRALDAWGGFINSAVWWTPIAVAYVLMAAVASWFQITLGRSDLRRGRRLLSIVLLAGLALTVVFEIRRGARSSNPTLERIRRGHIVRTLPDGWRVLAVRLNGDPLAQPAGIRGLLWNSADGRHLFFRAPSRRAGLITASADGETIAWVSFTVDDFRVNAIDLGQEELTEAEPFFSRSLRDPVRALALTSAGDRLAIATPRRVDIYSTREGRRESTHRVSSGWIEAVKFDAAGNLMVYRIDPNAKPAPGQVIHRQRLVLSELDAESGELTDVAASIAFTSMIGDLDVQAAHFQNRQSVFDTRTLELVWQAAGEESGSGDGRLASSDTGRIVGALPDGRLLTTTAGRLMAYAAGTGPDLKPEAATTIDLPEPAKKAPIRLISGLGPDEVVLLSKSSLVHGTLWRVDLVRGTWTELAEGVTSISVQPTGSGQFEIVAITDQHVVHVNPNGASTTPLLVLARSTWLERMNDKVLMRAVH